MQDLEQFKNDMNLSGKNVYVGHRYVPKIFGEWDNAQIYEPLSIVQYQGNSFTSRQFVPSGIEITNEEFWVSTGNYNAQVEQYRQDVRNLGNDINNINDEVITARNGESTLNERFLKEKQEINDKLGKTPTEKFNIKTRFNAVGDSISDDYPFFLNALNTIGTDEATITIPEGVYRLSSNISFPSNIHFDFINGAKLLPDENVIVEIEGVINAGNYEIFDFSNNGEIFLFESSNMYNISNFSGDSLNKKWDNLRKSLTQNRPYQLVIPQPSKNQSGSIESVAGEWSWKVDGTLHFGDPENLGTWFVLGKLYVTQPIDSVINIGFDKKSEYLNFPIGFWIEGNKLATNGIVINKGARMFFGENLSIHNVDNGLVLENNGMGGVGEIVINHLYTAEINNNSILMVGANDNSKISNVDIKFITGENLLQNTSNIIKIEGRVEDIVVDKIYSKTTKSLNIDNVVVIESNAKYRPIKVSVKNLSGNNFSNGVLLRKKDAESYSFPYETNLENIKSINIEGGYYTNINLTNKLTIGTGATYTRVKANTYSSQVIDNGSLTNFNGVTFINKATNVDFNSSQFELGDRIFNKYDSTFSIKIKNDGTPDDIVTLTS